MKHKNDYTELPNKILNDKRLKPMDKLLFWAVSSFAYGKKTICFPSEQTLSQVCDISVSTVKRAVRNLTAFGYLKVIRRGRMQTNIYELLSGSDSSSKQTDSSSMSSGIAHPEQGDSSSMSLEAVQEKKKKEKKEGNAPSTSGASLQAETENDSTIPSASTEGRTGNSSICESGEACNGPGMLSCTQDELDAMFDEAVSKPHSSVAETKPTVPYTPRRAETISKMISFFAEIYSETYPNSRYIVSPNDEHLMNDIIQLAKDSTSDPAYFLFSLIVWIFTAETDMWEVVNFRKQPTIDRLHHLRFKLFQQYSQELANVQVESITTDIQKLSDIQWERVQQSKEEAHR